MISCEVGWESFRCPDKRAKSFEEGSRTTAVRGIRALADQFDFDLGTLRQGNRVSEYHGAVSDTTAI